MMEIDINRDPQVEEVWRTYLTTGRPPDSVKLPWFEAPGLRAVARRLPADPRCQVCYYPFSGLGGKLLRTFLHVEPSKMNPQLCNICERFAEAHPGGTEMEVSLLFADIRGSTPLAATMNPYEFSRLINRFYQVTTNLVYQHGGMVATLIGDGVAAFFVPAFTENHNYARAAVRAGQAILAATGHGRAEGPWVPVGVGVHTGDAYVGAVGEPGKNIDIAVLGDSVNVAARLSGQAQEGEMVISDETVRIGGLDPTGYEQRTLTLKGKDEPFEAWVYGAGTA
jgi:adenylate cyclase